MKVALVLIALLPVVFSAAIEKRFILDTFQKVLQNVVHDVLHVPSLFDVIHIIDNGLSSGSSLAACEGGCPAALARAGFGIDAILCSTACEAIHTLG